MNFTITGITGGFENLTDNFFNDLLNLSGPEILELAWPGLQPTVEGVVAEVSICTVLIIAIKKNVEKIRTAKSLHSL